VSQQCEIIGVKTNPDKALKFYAMGNTKIKEKSPIKLLSSRLNYVVVLISP
jgi:hypothetical protein